MNAIVGIHLVKRMFDECGTTKAEEFIRRVESGEYDVPSPWSDLPVQEAAGDGFESWKTTYEFTCNFGDELTNGETDAARAAWTACAERKVKP